MYTSETVKHPSFGMLEIAKYGGGKQSLFGSSIEHSGGVSITIKQADWRKEYGHDFYFGDENIITIDMSYNQFAEAITSGMNTSGVPCTIQSIQGKRVPQYHFENTRKHFENEFKEKMEKLTMELSQLIKQTEEILSSSKPPNKKEKELILKQLQKLQAELGSNIPFYNRTFNEAMDKTVMEAKAEIDGFYETKIRNLGIKVIEDLKLEKPKMIEV